MKKMRKKPFVCGCGFLAMFLVWTALITAIDVRAIGPQGTEVGFASLNEWMHALTGEHMILYMITDWLGLVPICIALYFSMMGLLQWIKRKCLWKVDRSILALGVFYVVVIAVYVLFEVVVINYRPILVEGDLEASYPSSTTLLVLCVLPTAIMQLRARIKHGVLKNATTVVAFLFVVFMVVGRLASGVHWVTDIIGGAFLSTGLVLLYSSFCGLKDTRENG